MSARISPGGLRELGLPIWAFSHLAGRVTKTPAPAVLTTLGRGRGLLWGWVQLAGMLMPGGKLPRRERELVILRVASLRGCGYEFEHHRTVGRRIGLTRDEIKRVQVGSSAEGWMPEQQLLLEITEELLTTRDLSDISWALLRERYDERTCIELLLLIGHHDMLATTLMTLRVEPDQPRG